MNNDLISRNALLKEFRDFKDMDCPSGHTITADYMIEYVENVPAVEAEAVRHGRWILEAHDERVNCRWNVTARCSECSDEENEIWAGFFPGVPDCIAKDVALQDARQVKLSNYCPNCGAKMDAEDAQHGP